ncbi:PhzF family phenazine biosynthesis protein [Desulfatirhabdium butyrativorans]|uniref:PhzF family phenazine biosynthesis protein n=1 Tax=Desulfatirhabdium butyrativorans TaxID=340467 RepID=UPI00042855CF|nr:PhzF family phenazine biosynthesis protein [Desulfatirhabdium butyrativorans]
MQMRTYPYKKINAFTSGISLGNPAAFIDLGTDLLSEQEMLKIAKEHQGFISEIVYVTRHNNQLKLTYYSSECEVSFCGHGTIATMYEIIKHDDNLLNKKQIQIETNKKGILTVYNEIKKENAIYVSAPEPIWLVSKALLSEVTQALLIEPYKISAKLPIDFIDAGLRTLIIPINKLIDEISIYPDIKQLEKFCIKNEIDIILIFSNEVSNSEYFVHTRVFAPKFGYLEDPATGSGNSALGYYLIKNKLWDKDIIRIEQGGKDIVYNEIKLIQRDGKVLFGGKATKKIEGTYYLD